MWIDPDGRTAVGDAISGFFKRGGVDQAVELAELVGSENRTTGQVVGAIAAVFGAAADAVAFGVDAVDLVADVVVAGVAGDSDVGVASAEALLRARDTAGAVFEMVTEHPGEVAAAIGNGVKETAVGVAQGDPAAITRATAFIAEAVAGGAGPSSQGWVLLHERRLDSRAMLLRGSSGRPTLLSKS